MTCAHTLGFPRIGAKRELKFALESYWRGETTQAELVAVGKSLRERHWQAQRTAGVNLLPVGDFAWYDQVLGTSLLVDAVPARHRHGDTDLDTLFRVARGRAPTGPAAAAAGSGDQGLSVRSHSTSGLFSNERTAVTPASRQQAAK